MHEGKWIPALMVELITAGLVVAMPAGQSQESITLGDILQKAGERVERYPDSLLKFSSEIKLVQ